MEIKFYFCDHCKNVAIKVVDHKVPLFCCGEKMTELVPGTVDAAVEKHLPEYTVKKRDCLRTCRLRGASDDPGALYLPDRRADRPRCAV